MTEFSVIAILSGSTSKKDFWYSFCWLFNKIKLCSIIFFLSYIFSKNWKLSSFSGFIFAFRKTEIEKNTSLSEIMLRVNRVWFLKYASEDISRKSIGRSANARNNEDLKIGGKWQKLFRIFRRTVKIPKVI